MADRQVMGIPLRVLGGIALVAALAGFAAWQVIPDPAPRFHGTTYDPVAPAADFRLVDQDGRPVTLASYRGHPVLLFFGYVHCPDVCPLTLAKLSRVLDRLEGDGEDVRVLLVTVDPARDTPAVLKAYVERFGRRISGLTGDSAAVVRAGSGYGVYAVPQPAGGHAGHGGGSGRIAHTGVVYGIDRAGMLRVVIPAGGAEEETLRDVRTLVRLPD